MPERSGRWDLLDRPSDPVAADTVAIDERLTYFRSLSEMLRVEGERLSRIGSGESLRGEYADELRSAATEVAKDLNQTVGRYKAVVSALADYRPALDAALVESASALDDAIDAAGARGVADGILLAAAEPGSQLTPQQVQSNADKRSATDAASGRLQAAKDRLAGALRRLDEAGQRAAATVREGFDDGLKDSGWYRFKHDLKKILKILVKVLEYIGIALAILAIFIPGLGPIIFAIGAAALATSAALFALGEGSWEDVAMSVVGMLTLGAGKAGKFVGRKVVEAARTRMGRPPRARRGADDDGIPLIDRGATESVGSSSALPTRFADSRTTAPAPASPAPAPAPLPARTELEIARDWGVPNGSTSVAHPDDFGPNQNLIKEGTSSWISPTNVTYTRFQNWVGFRGMTGDGADLMVADGAISRAGKSNGHDNANWKAFYAMDEPEKVYGYASEPVPPRYRYGPGDVVRYDNGREVTIATPDKQLGQDKNGVDDSGVPEARQAFPDVPDSHRVDGVDEELPLMEGLGRQNTILRNPLDNEDKYEFIIPWDISAQGTVTRYGKMLPGGFNPEFEKL